MSITASTDGPHFSSGSISFSTLRDTFRLNSGTISASELRRDTNTNNSNPIVPDATENSSISNSSNLSLSQFRNSIKYYNVTQSGSDSDISFESTSYWNGNQGKNIVKKLYITGTIGDTTSSSASARYRGDNVTTYNLGIIISGNIYGLAGRGGGRSGSDGLNGTNGGSAFRVVGSGSGTGTIDVNIQSGARVWAGGGGGEKGVDGAKGLDGTCRINTSVQGCGTRPGCPSGYFETGTYNGGCCQTYSYCCGLFNCGCTACSQYIQGRNCAQDYTISGGDGGAGGSGGNGRGWDNFTGSISGSSGASGQEPPGNCGGNQLIAYATKGADGGKGGDGGDWGSSGSSTNNTGSAGEAGYAFFGRNFNISGNNNSSTVKGRINYNF